MHINKENLRFSTDRYTLTFGEDRPFVSLDDADGNRLADLFVLSGVQPLDGRDDTTQIGCWQVEESSAETVFTLRAQSSAWKTKTYRFRCRPRRCVYEVEVEGTGRLADVQYFGGYSSAQPRWGSGFFLSGHAFKSGFNPEPNADFSGSELNPAGWSLRPPGWSLRPAGWFDPAGGAVVDLVGAPLPGKRHWFFNPAPFCFAFETEQTWIGLGVEAAPGANRFTEYRYHGQNGFYLSLSYDGHTQVDGAYRLPAIGIDFADGPYEALQAHVSALPAASPSPPTPPPPRGEGSHLPSHKPAWWSRPMFCGWGEQCYRAAAEHGYLPGNPENVDGPAFLATMRFAPDYARQDVYRESLSALARHGIHPGTVVVDDKWQLTYGENAADPTKWPDLRDFVDDRHADGQKLLLWLKAWDREGVPDDECIANAAGLPLTVDPTNPSYEQRLRASVHRMLGSQGYDADGFKIDFTHRIPTGPGLRMHAEGTYPPQADLRPQGRGGLPGLELMKCYLGIIYDQAKRTKPDALIVTHTPHPYLADVLDMIRLNDMLDLTRLDQVGDIGRAMTFRACVARTACRQALIDTDNWPVRDRQIWRDYIRLQPSIGVPSLYFATHIDLTQEPLEAADYQLLRETWASYEP